MERKNARLQSENISSWKSRKGVRGWDCWGEGVYCATSLKPEHQNYGSPMVQSRKEHGNKWGQTLPGAGDALTGETQEDLYGNRKWGLSCYYPPPIHLDQESPAVMCQAQLQKLMEHDCRREFQALLRRYADHKGLEVKLRQCWSPWPSEQDATGRGPACPTTVCAQLSVEHEGPMCFSEGWRKQKRGHLLHLQ